MKLTDLDIPSSYQLSLMPSCPEHGQLGVYRAASTREYYCSFLVIGPAGYIPSGSMPQQCGWTLSELDWELGYRNYPRLPVSRPPAPPIAAKLPKTEVDLLRERIEECQRVGREALAS